MFTLKLYRRDAILSIGPGTTKILSYHHVDSKKIGESTLEIRAFHGPEPATYDQFYIGRRTKEMTALNDGNHWEWGLLENANGRTTEHFRPYTYG